MEIFNTLPWPETPTKIPSVPSSILGGNNGLMGNSDYNFLPIENKQA
jgi:hypothetical protein